MYNENTNNYAKIGLVLANIIYEMKVCEKLIKVKNFYYLFVENACTSNLFSSAANICFLI